MGEPGAQNATVDVVAAVEALPPLPAVALRVMQVAQDPKASASDLALVVSSDPGLSSRILRVVNSAAYRRMREITSVQQALVTIGFVQARNLAISGAIAGAYAPDALNALFRVETFWRHSIAVAFKAAEYAGRGRRVDVPSAFTAGIVHNMGRLALYYKDPALVDQAVARAVAEDRTLEEIELNELGFDHAAAGALLARKWKLPEPICEAIGRHHEPLETDQTLAGCVAMADRYVVGNGLLPGYVVPPAVGTRPEPTPEFAGLMRQVQALMELVTGNPVGVRAA
ncbi:HDOD domain-containing protein [Tepidiforma sp.]|uniref:HDOD domain-containing protein n=1 Tax=Tepidiforma sp. TaxID=2682230 RepID=UPI002ADDC173|nr:HDOD domain-containing protein [Tepidiforma sp.]